MPPLHAHGERKRQHSRLAETMQTPKEARKSASAPLNPRTFPQCDTNCLCQRWLTTNPPKRQHFHQFLVERTGWNHQSSRSRCNSAISNQALMDPVYTIESLLDTQKQSPTLLSRPYNTIDRQRQHLGQALSPRIRRRTYSSRHPTVLRLPLRRAFAWPEQPLVPGKVDTTGKLKS